MIDRETFQTKLKLLAGRFPHFDLRAEVVAEYYRVLSERMTTEQFLVAVEEVFMVAEFFPSPQAFIEAAGDRPRTEEERRQYVLDHHRPARLGQGKWAGWQLGAGEHPQLEPPADENLGRPPADVLDKLEMLTHPGRSLDDIRARNLRMEEYEAEGMKNPPKIELPPDFVVGGKPKGDSQ